MESAFSSECGCDSLDCDVCPRTDNQLCTITVFGANLTVVLTDDSGSVTSDGSNTGECVGRERSDGTVVNCMEDGESGSVLMKSDSVYTATVHKIDDFSDSFKVEMFCISANPTSFPTEDPVISSGGGGGGRAYFAQMQHYLEDESKIESLEEKKGKKHSENEKLEISLSQWALLNMWAMVIFVLFFNALLMVWCMRKREESEMGIDERKYGASDDDHDIETDVDF